MSQAVTKEAKSRSLVALAMDECIHEDFNVLSALGFLCLGIYSCGMGA